MMDHPCFHCSLPECDDAHKRCAIRQYQARYKQKMRNGEVDTATDLERVANAEAWLIYKYNKQSEVSA